MQAAAELTHGHGSSDSCALRVDSGKLPARPTCTRPSTAAAAAGCSRHLQSPPLCCPQDLLQPRYQAAMAEASTSYRVLPVRLISPSGGPPLTRYLYVRPHSNPEDGLPKDRAVFVAGIPLQLQGTPLVDLFGQFGDIERAALHSTRVSAVLLYAAAAGRDKLMRATGKRRPVQLQLPEPQETHGLKGVRAVCGCTGMNRQQRQQAAHRRGGLACVCRGHTLSVPHANGLQASHFTVHPLCSLECSLGGGAPGAETGQCGAAGTLGLDSALPLVVQQLWCVDMWHVIAHPSRVQMASALSPTSTWYRRRWTSTWRSGRLRMRRSVRRPSRPMRRRAGPWCSATRWACRGGAPGGGNWRPK